MKEFSKRILNASLGHTHLFSIGQAGFIIKSSSGQLLGIDMYLSECVERVEGHVGYKRLLPQLLAPDELTFDCVVATHYHRDHLDIDAMPILMKNGRTVLFAAKDCMEDTRGYKCVKYVAPGDHAVCGDFTLDFMKCDHGTGAPQAVGVIVHVDGKKIYEAGDTCLHTEWARELPRDIDVMIAPINGAYGNMNEKECADYAQVVKPKLTIPCHYGMFASHGGEPGKFYTAMKEKRLPFFLMTQGEDVVL